MDNRSAVFSASIVLGILLFGFACLGIELYQVQVLDAPRYSEKARELCTVRITETGNRGQIKDAKGVILAGSKSCYDLLLDHRQISESNNVDCIIAAVSDELRKPRKEIEDLVRTPLGDYKDKGETKVAERISIEQKKALEEALQQRVEQKRKLEKQKTKGRQMIRFKGLRFYDSSTRTYPQRTLLAPILGYVDSSEHGTAGQEKQFDKYLQPYSASKSYERDARGDIYTAPFKEEGVKSNGCDVWLTIHEELQWIAEEEMATAAKGCAPESIEVVMADPKTGAILAMAQYPSFDPNDRGALNTVKDYISQCQFEPGSMMKGLTLSLVMDKGRINLDSIVDCHNIDGLWRVSDGRHAITENGGRVPLWKVLQKSSNVGTARVVTEKLSQVELYEGLSSYGLGHPTGVGLPMEVSGSLADPRKKRWSGPDQSRIAIGYTAAVTPMQLVQAYGALANGGRMMKLRLVESVRDGTTGEVVYENPPKPLGQPIQERTALQMTKALKLVTEEGGTATLAAIPGYRVAGKTGTSRKYDEKLKDYGDKYFCSFVGYVPADNPKIVMVVTVNAPARGGDPYVLNRMPATPYGGTTAGPIFQRIAKRTLEYMLVPPTDPVETPAANPQ